MPFRSGSHIAYFIAWIEMNRKHYYIYISLFILSFFLVKIDKPFSDFLHFGMKPWDPHLQFFTFMGDGWFLIPTSFLLTIGYLIYKKTWKPPLVTFLGLLNFFFSGAIVQITKYVTSRPRPYLADDIKYDSMDFNMFYWLVDNSDYRSFPSGHTAAVFSFFWMICFFIPMDIKKRALLLGFATLIAFTRVALGKHFFADIVAGAAIAMFTGTVILELYYKKNKKHAFNY